MRILVGKWRIDLFKKNVNFMHRHVPTWALGSYAPDSDYDDGVGGGGVVGGMAVIDILQQA
jgi:hypothetical protein